MTTFPCKNSSNICRSRFANTSRLWLDCTNDLVIYERTAACKHCWMFCRVVSSSMFVRNFVFLCVQLCAVEWQLLQEMVSSWLQWVIKKLTNKESEQHQLKVRTKQISLHRCVHVETMTVMLCQPLSLFYLDFFV